MTFQEFFNRYIPATCDCIMYTYLNNYSGNIDGWISKPSDCKKLQNNKPFHAEYSEILGRGNFKRIGKEIIKI